MHLVENKSKYGRKIYNSILLRESYRENGKVKKRTIANLSKCSANEIAAIRFALKNKHNIEHLISIDKDIKLEQGLAFGAVWAISEIAKRIGIKKALGKTFQGQLSMWQVISRVINRGSRLSSVRLAQTHACCEVLGFSKGFNEDDLYKNLEWLALNQKKIEQNLLNIKRKDNKPDLFLYDVTSSYLEGTSNYFGNFGYSRDKKRGKQQIVIGLMCDEFGEPISTEVFSGNTNDLSTFASQVKKASDDFGCDHVTFVGDRGMIKQKQIEELPKNFHYITAITKAQINALIKRQIIREKDFDVNLFEVEYGNIRYILKRNPIRAKEIMEVRLSKKEAIKRFIIAQNTYLKEHPRAKNKTAFKKAESLIAKLKVGSWLKVIDKHRELFLTLNALALEAESKLDGCYALKTDLGSKILNKKKVHARYKDLAFVEKAFRTCKTGLLEVRPIYVRKEKSTQGHVFIVMLAYMIVRYLQNVWKELDITVKEGLAQLDYISSTTVKIKNDNSFFMIPKPNATSKKLLDLLGLKLPSVLPRRKVNVVTKKT